MKKWIGSIMLSGGIVAAVGPNGTAPAADADGLEPAGCMNLGAVRRQLTVNGCGTDGSCVYTIPNVDRDYCIVFQGLTCETLQADVVTMTAYEATGTCPNCQSTGEEYGKVPVYQARRVSQPCGELADIEI